MSFLKKDFKKVNINNNHQYLRNMISDVRAQEKKKLELKEARGMISFKI